MKNVSFYITDISDRTIFFRKASGGTDHSLSIKTLEKMYDDEDVGDIQGLKAYYKPLLSDLLSKGKSNEVPPTKESFKRYVMVIDEINRANISRVFGELITLLEKDKRFDAANQLVAKLPSGEEFVIPPNLHVIGTMNTADKSIALLDIALRRRFSFKPFYPRPDLIEDSQLRGIFEKLNDKIKKEKSVDFTIGHSYFMDKTIDDLEAIMDDHVIPLLVEYFMNELGDVRDLLKGVGIDVDDSLGYLKYKSLTQ